MKGENAYDFPFHYGQEAESYTFYRVPKILFTAEAFDHLSTDAKLLYGILLDRMQLSVKNSWIDADGKVAQTFIDDACEPSEWRQGTPMTYTFDVKTDLKAGLYLWAVAIVDTTRDCVPGIQLAIASLSKTEDGWTKLSNVTVE